MKRCASTHRALLATIGLLLCLTAGACSTVTRYHVLSFFFDGVPVPAGVGLPADSDATAGREHLGSSAGRGLLSAPARPFVPAVKIASVHAPYGEGKCGQCHDMNRIGIEDIAHEASLCDRCHLEQRERDGWDHGPINLGTCIPCHVPHESEHPKLLAMAMTDLCLTCHEGVLLDVEQELAYHDVPNLPDCVACHDPHRMY